MNAASISSPAIEDRQAVSLTRDQQEFGDSRLPILCVTVAAGLLVTAIAHAASRSHLGWAALAFWLGLLLIYAPAALRLARSDIKRHESIAIVVLVGLALYLVKFFHSPLALTFHDEFIWWRTTSDIVRHHHLFSPNPLLTVSPYFPGLANVADALTTLGSQSVFVAALFVVAAARLVLLLALYLLYYEASGSVQVAGLGALLYMANPNFLFFSSQFAYESLALPLLLVVLCALTRAQRETGWRGRKMAVLAIAAICGLIPTHHLTTYALWGVLTLWFLLDLVIRSQRRNALLSGLAAVVAIVGGLLWLFGVAPETAGYLAPHFQDALSEIARILQHKQGAGRQPFQSVAGPAAPTWERVTGIAATGLLSIGLLVGLWRTRSRLNATPRLVLTAIGLLYPVSVALRLTSAGWEIGSRSSEFVFIGLAFVVASGVQSGPWKPSQVKWRSILLALCASIAFMGGVIAGWPATLRLPASYAPGPDERSIDRQGLAASRWAADTLGPGHRFTGDYGDAFLMGSYGEQQLVRTMTGGPDTSWIFYAPEIGGPQRDLIHHGRVQYIVLDRRLSSQSSLGTVFEGDDPRGARYLGKTIPLPLLRKFDRTPGISRVYDGGDVRIYRTNEAGHDR